MILIGNGRVLTRDCQHPWYENGGVLTEGEHIKQVGDTKELKEAYPEAEFVDARGNVIMPGMINCHEHIYSAFARGFTPPGYAPGGFLDILDGMWWTIDRNLTLNQTKKSARATFLDSIRNGVTTVFDHHASYGEIEGSLFAIAEEAKELGVRACLCYEVSDREGREKMIQAVKENEAFLLSVKKEDSRRLQGMMGMHAQFTLSDETMEYCIAHTPEGAGYHIHVAEGIEDLHHCLKTHGKRIVNRLMDFGILGGKTIAAHCIYINAQEMELLRETGTIVVHNPESNMGNACGCPPTMEILRKGILTGLGTDGYTHDLLESIKVANVLHKHHLCDANAAWAEVPQMAFQNNAKIAGLFFDTPLGILKEGAAADVIVMEYQPLTPMSDENAYGHALFGMCGRDCLTTMANGRLLMKDRELLGIDMEKEMAECREEAKKLWKSIRSAGGKQNV